MPYQEGLKEALGLFVKAFTPMSSDPMEQKVKRFAQEMRETYVQLGKALIPLLTNSPEGIRTLLELGEVYETLGCEQEAVAAYSRARSLAPDCLPESARQFLENHPTRAD